MRRQSILSACFVLFTAQVVTADSLGVVPVEAEADCDGLGFNRGRRQATCREA